LLLAPILLHHTPLFLCTTPPPSSSTTNTIQDAYIKQAPPPAPECCKAAQDFNDAKCSCNAAVLNLAVQFTGGNPAIYKSGG